VDGHAVGLAGQVPQGNLDGADPSRLSCVVPELFDAAEELVDLARVLAQDSALEHQGVRLAGAVAHLAVAH